MRTARRIQRMVPEGGRLLDVGSASGIFLNVIARNPEWQVEGIEPSSFGAEYAREHFGLKIHNGFLHDQRFEDSYFDVVTSLDTFFFHPDPNKDLAEMSRILRPGGLLVVEIPGLKFRLLKNTGRFCKLIYKEPVRLNAGVHLYYYSRKTFSLLAGSFSLKLIRCFPEQSPRHGPMMLKMLSDIYYLVTGIPYTISSGKLNFAPKELLMFMKG